MELLLFNQYGQLGFYETEAKDKEKKFLGFAEGAKQQDEQKEDE